MKPPTARGNNRDSTCVADDHSCLANVVHIAVHASQFPDAVERDLAGSLRTRQVNHKFHYDSVKQTRKWLALHQALSPSRRDPECAAIYSRSFAEAVSRLDPRRTHLLGLGCGGGQKDARLLKMLRDAGKQVSYTPCDVSQAMVLVARETALAFVPEARCAPFVCDLASADDPSEALAQFAPREAARLVTFFGMIPNFEPAMILPRLARLLRHEDLLLFSANLAPGSDYAAGLARILPQYDNLPTREWLLTFLLDLGVERTDGELIFGVEGDPAGSGLKRVAANFRFSQARQLALANERFAFGAGECLRLFFSYRHTPALVRDLLRKYGLHVLDQWVTESAEEGVFLVRREDCSPGAKECQPHLG
jgi:uncharacterized SAM-dependent methyltransferase